MKFVTADLHFGHRNILEYQAHTRPYESTEEMDEAIIENWNSDVALTDEVYIVGDIGLCSRERLESCLSRLHGRLYLVAGNHDHAARKSRIGNFFEWVRDYHELRYENNLFVMCHYPIFSWNRMAFGSIHLYGHTHGQIPHMPNGKSMDVGVDTNEMRVYNLSDVAEKFKDFDNVDDPRGRNR